LLCTATLLPFLPQTRKSLPTVFRFKKVARLQLLRSLRLFFQKSKISAVKFKWNMSVAYSKRVEAIRADVDLYVAKLYIPSVPSPSFSLLANKIHDDTGLDLNLCASIESYTLPYAACYLQTQLEGQNMEFDTFVEDITEYIIQYDNAEAYMQMNTFVSESTGAFQEAVDCGVLELDSVNEWHDALRIVFMSKAIQHKAKSIIGLIANHLNEYMFCEAVENALPNTDGAFIVWLSNMYPRVFMSHMLRKHCYAEFVAYDDLESFLILSEIWPGQSNLRAYPQSFFVECLACHRFNIAEYILHHANSEQVKHAKQALKEEFRSASPEMIEFVLKQTVLETQDLHEMLISSLQRGSNMHIRSLVKKMRQIDVEFSRHEYILALSEGTHFYTLLTDEPDVAHLIEAMRRFNDDAVNAFVNEYELTEEMKDLVFDAACKMCRMRYTQLICPRRLSKDDAMDIFVVNAKDEPFLGAEEFVRNRFHGFEPELTEEDVQKIVRKLNY
jgi:hypothetical protein